MGSYGEIQQNGVLIKNLRKSFTPSAGEQLLRIYFIKSVLMSLSWENTVLVIRSSALTKVWEILEKLENKTYEFRQFYCIIDALASLTHES